MSKSIFTASLALVLTACATTANNTESSANANTDCQQLKSKIAAKSTPATTKSTLEAYYNKQCQ
ncbi:MAG: hypothetical protein ACPG8A_01810 [Psychrobium sp.]